MRSILVIISFLGGWLGTMAQNVNFFYIGSNNGLSQNTVRAIAEDSNGFIWAGTLDGLNRYDGYHIRPYAFPAGFDCRTLHIYPSTHCRQLLWVETYQHEWCCYDAITDRFCPLRLGMQDKLVYDNFLEAGNGTIWLWGKDQGLCSLRRQDDGSWLGTEHLTAADECLFAFEDSGGTVWAGGAYGLSCFRPDGQRTDFHAGIYRFTAGTEWKGRLFFATDQSALLECPVHTTELAVTPCPFGENIEHFYPLSADQLLLLTGKTGMWTYRWETRKFDHPDIYQQNPRFREQTRIATDNRGGYWFYYYNKGDLWYCDGQDIQFRQVKLVEDFHRQASPFSIGEVRFDSKGTCWITTYGFGLYRYDVASGEVANYRYGNRNTGPASDYLMPVIEDRWGDLWIGSEYAGIIHMVNSPDYIRLVRPECGNAIGKNNNVRSILEDSQGNVWVGLKNGGLYVYDSQLEHPTCIGTDLNPYALAEDQLHRMWVAGKEKGIYVYDVKTRRQLAHLHHRVNDPTSLVDDAVFHILIDSQQRIWTASFNEGGIGLIEEKDGQFSFRNFLTGNGNLSMFRYLFQDKEGRIWAGTSEGLVRFLPDELLRDPQAYQTFTADIRHPHSLSSNDIKYIYQDHNGTIWIGTAGGGLNKYLPADRGQEEGFEHYSVGNGFPDNYTLGILETGDFLWISTEKGLTRFDPKKGSATSYSFGLSPAGATFNEAACLKRKDGTLLWGSLDGLLVFNPQQFRPSSKVSPVLITRLRIKGTDWEQLSDADTRCNISYTSHIDLDYQQNSLALQFAMPNLKAPELSRYSYMLEGFDKDWSVPGTSNEAVYKQLPPGKYLFKVKGSNADGIWGKDITRITFQIHPPLWESPWAYLLYFLLSAALLYLLFRLTTRFYRLRNAVKVEKQLTDFKLRFFTNVSHEFRTPLTIIQGAVEMLDDCTDLPAAAQKQVRLLDRNANALRQLINQLLEFRKIQNNVLSLDLEEVDMVDFAHDCFIGFQDLAIQKNIDYRFTPAVPSVRLFIDHKKIDKVVNNLLSNAFKFTPEGGRIELTVEEDPDHHLCTLAVSDTGIGIPKEKRHLLFSRFGQINFSATGTGIGLSLVKEFMDVHKGKVFYREHPGGGSVFVIELSTDKATYSNEHFIDKTEILLTDTPKNLSSLAGTVPEVSTATLADYRVLVIDDNEDIRNYLRESLGTRLKVLTADSGQEGIRMAQEQCPDLILCDVMMPELDGFEVTRRLKSDFHTSHIPIILLTAYTSMEHRIEGIESGADDYITKPFSLKYVRLRVMKMIAQREQLRKRFSTNLSATNVPAQATNQDKSFYERMETLLNTYYAETDFTVERFVQLSGLGRTVFFAKIKSLTGYSPNELIKMRRLKEAARLLKETDLNVSEVSYKIGFEDPFYFSKCFKAYYQCTPKQFRTTP